MLELLCLNRSAEMLSRDCDKPILYNRKGQFLGFFQFCEASADVGVVPQCLFPSTCADNRNATMEPNGKMSLGASSVNLHGTTMLLDTRKDSWHRSVSFEAFNRMVQLRQSPASFRIRRVLLAEL